MNPDEEPLPLIPGRLRAPTLRSRLMLDVAAELVGQQDWMQKQAMISLRVQGAAEWGLHLMASDAPSTIPDVVSGAVDVGIVNPASAAGPTLARLGHPAGTLSSIATVPSYDQVGIAVPAKLGIATLEEFIQARPPVIVSLRDQRDHAIHAVLEDMFQAAGGRLADIDAWGGSLQYDWGLPHFAVRSARMRDGEVDSMFDEGIYNWTDLATQAGMRFLELGEETAQRLEAQGYRRAYLRKTRFPDLDRDVLTVDFSGFMIYCRTDADDAMIEAFCRALHARSGTIAWQGGTGLPLEWMVTDHIDAPIALPLHPAAERYWRSAGLLT